MNIDFQIFGEGNPVVLLHAFPLSNKMWSDNYRILIEKGFKVILPNLFFESGKTTAMEDTAARIIELLDSLKINKAIIGGLSMGGYVTFNMFRICPKKFAAIILCDTNSASDTIEKRNARFDLIKKIEKNGNLALIENTLHNLVSDYTKNETPEIYQKIQKWVSESDPQVHINALQAMASRLDHDYLLSKINVPAQLIFGHEDEVTGLEIAEKLNSQIKDSKLAVIEKAGHYSNLEQQEKFNDLISEFCLSVEF